MIGDSATVLRGWLRPSALAAMATALFASPAAQASPTTTVQSPPAASRFQEHPADVSIPDTRRISFSSKVNGRTYLIDIAYPQFPQPKAGYPVIYVLDGNVYFASFTEAVRVNGNAPQAIVVGIGYPYFDPTWPATVLSKIKSLPTQMTDPSGVAFSLARFHDLTPTANDTLLKQMIGDGQIFSRDDTGGVDDFLKVIETDVKPTVYAVAEANHVQINRADQTLFGHSLGGLAVIEAIFTEPKAFRTFIAASPSIWWSDKAVLAKEAAFDTRVNAGDVSPRILVTVGGDEESVPSLPPALEARRAEIEASQKKNRMIGNACDLVSRLKALHGAQGYEAADCAVFPQQDHGISVWPAIGRAVSFAFPR